MVVAMELYPIIAAAPTSKTRRAPHFIGKKCALQCEPPRYPSFGRILRPTVNSRGSSLTRYHESMKRIGLSRRVGLARALSKLGYCSRAEASRLIRAGRVRVNERLCSDPEKPVYLKRDRIEIDGHLLETQPKIYLMLNKPRGLITTASDEKGRDTVYELLDQQLSWVAPVGRLDKASEGLLLLTNDPEWSARVLAPETHLEKIYHVQIAAVADGAIIKRMTKGVKDGNDFLRAKNARIVRGGSRNTWLEIVLDEGKNRHIRRILAQLGIEALRLVRVAIGPLRLGELPKGSVRQLAVAEKQGIDRAMERLQTAARQSRGEALKKFS